MSATVKSRNNQMIDVGYLVDVNATAEIGWETDEEPTGWNHRTDQPTYTSYSTAVFGDIKINSLKFTPNGYYIIDNNEVDFNTFQQNVSPQSLKELLNPNLYIPEINKLFTKAVENLEEPEPDFNEPEGDY